MTRPFLLPVTLLLPLTLVLGCSGSSSTKPQQQPPPPALLLGCTDAVADVYTAPAGLPPFDASHRGDVIRCAYDRYLSAAQLNAKMTAYGYLGDPLPSGAWIFRFAYRTERIAPAGGASAPEGISSALLLVPDVPRAATAPLVLFAHASVGIAPACAPSTYDLVADVAGDDHRGAVLGLAGYGWTLVVPDYAGFGYDEPPGWSVAEDEAHSVLDATRAARQLVPNAPDDVVFVGHSQGGHAALAAQAYAGRYGMAGHLLAVATFAPLWLSAYAWGAILDPVAQFTTAASPYPVMYDLDYFYSHGELYDGPGGGLAMIQPAKRDAVKSFLLGQCSPMAPAVDISTLGATPSDIFDSAFVSSLGDCSVGFGSCSDATATTWTARFVADRPAIDANGPPLLVFDGGKDDNFPPPRAQCMFDKLHADLAQAAAPTTTISTCFDPDAQHFDIVRRDVAYVNQWIAARAGLGPEPAPCTPFPSGQTCQTPPPNL